MTRKAWGIRPAYFHCYKCGVLKNTEVTEEYYGELHAYFCNHCGDFTEKIDTPQCPPHCPHPRSEPRIIDLTKPMVCIVSVRVTEEMEENGDIPF